MYFGIESSDSKALCKLIDFIDGLKVEPGSTTLYHQEENPITQLAVLDEQIAELKTRLEESQKLCLVLRRIALGEFDCLTQDEVEYLMTEFDVSGYIVEGEWNSMSNYTKDLFVSDILEMARNST